MGYINELKEKDSCPSGVDQQGKDKRNENGGIDTTGMKYPRGKGTVRWGETLRGSPGGGGVKGFWIQATTGTQETEVNTWRKLDLEKFDD